MTERLYYTDAASLSFEGTIVAVDEGGRRVYLDRTAFYPTSGGQPHDTGVLGEVRVVDVMDEGARIAHVLDAPIGRAAGARVRGVVDAARRRDHMQQHTGQHLLSAVFEELFGAATVSVHFGGETSLVELDAAELTPEQLAAAEQRANALVAEGRPVTVAFEDAATASGLRKATQREGIVRIVTIAGLDRSACGGTHVASTAEIGPVLLRGVERIRQRVRVQFLCGHRALAAARRDHELLRAMAGAFSAAPADLPDLVTAQSARLRALEAERSELLRQLSTARAAALHGAAAMGADGRRWVTERLPPGAMERLRETARAMSELPGAVYIGTVEGAGTIVVAAAADTGLDAGALLKAALTAAGGKGGGSAQMAQGSVPDAAGVPAVVTVLQRAGA